MAEYIERDAAIAACFDGFADCRDDCAANIRSIPAADVVERKTGKWILPNNEVAVYLNEWICSACNHLIDGKHNFCPNCGAEMRPRPKEGSL